jgi:transcriptional regulator with GAF, ATPase, and Fis domain
MKNDEKHENDNRSAAQPLFAALAQTVAQSTDEQAIWAHTQQVANAVIGHLLFTVMRHDTSASDVARIYSSKAAEYPPGVKKHKGPTPWGTRVLQQGQFYIGYNSADIESNFSDHAIIASMGLASILNLPIRVANTTLGTINLLNVENYYDESQVEAGTILAAIVAPALMTTH